MLRCFGARGRLVIALLFVGLQFSIALAQTRPVESPSHLEFLHKLSAAAIERTNHTVRYDPAYVHLAYPGGDVPADTGVCTDEVIRSYRVLGIDLQKDVHEDMVQDFGLYPRRW
jgi:uncharacterized protein YijF (DUF1287 family)